MVFSKNKKLNNVLSDIYEDLIEIDIEQIKRYMGEFKDKADYNLAEYGNCRVYHWQVRELYSNYKSLAKMSDSDLWELYKRQVGYVARIMVKGE